MISFVIVSWNASSYLRKCLSSIYCNSIKSEFEVIVIDNGSSDDSVEMVKNEFPHAKIVETHRNFGFSKGNNIGIKLARGEWLYLVNSDVVVLPNSINLLDAFVRADERIGICGPRILDKNFHLQRSCMGKPTLWRIFCTVLSLDKMMSNCKIFSGYMMRWWNYSSSMNVDILNGCFWAIRRKAIDDVGLLDEQFFMYGEDMDYCVRLRESGWKVMYCNETAVVHYGGASSDNNPTRFYLEMYKANLKYWRKHQGMAAVAVYNSLIIAHHILRVAVRSILLPMTHDKEKAKYKIQRSWRCLLFFLKLYRI